jgi:ketosteroid isomerase-like protein
MLNHDDAMRLFEQRRDAWLAEDLERYLAFFAEDVIFQSPVHEKPLRGKKAYEELVRTSAPLVRPIAFDITSLAVHGNRALAEWTITLEWRNEARQISYSGMSSATIKDGLITEWREYWNAGDLKMS